MNKDNGSHQFHKLQGRDFNHYNIYIYISIHTHTTKDQRQSNLKAQGRDWGFFFLFKLEIQSNVQEMGTIFSYQTILFDFLRHFSSFKKQAN